MQVGRTERSDLNDVGNVIIDFVVRGSRTFAVILGAGIEVQAREDKRCSPAPGGAESSTRTPVPDIWMK